MTVSPAPRRPLPRRWLLSAAAAVGFVAALALGPAPAPTTALERIVVAEAKAQTPPAPPETPKAAPDAPRDAAEAPKARGLDAEVTIDGRGVTVRKHEGRSGEAHVVVGDHEFDSFEQFVEQAPWLAGLVFMVTALVFVVPLLVIVLVIWYKVRRTRMMNETLLKLAERGVVPPAEAMEAIASGRPAPSLQEVPAAAPLYEHAKALRKRAAASDLRKGVLLAGVGLALTAWSGFDDGSPNAIGLILLFVGIGYVILWYMEDRPARDTRGAGGPPAGGA